MRTGADDGAQGVVQDLGRAGVFLSSEIEVVDAVVAV
jgi:hypothetical protein